MAIGRISGSVLKSNLTRNGVDLAIETNLLYLDVTNSRIGIGTSEPSTTLQVSGTVTATAFAGDGSNLTNVPATLGDLTAVGSTLQSPSNANLVLDPSGTGKIVAQAELVVNTLSSDDSSAIQINDNIDMGGNIIPRADDTYTLGSPTSQWAALYVTGSTIYLGDLALSTDTGNNSLKVLKKKAGRGKQHTSIANDYEATAVVLNAPAADTDASTKKYVDDSIAAVSTTSITQGNSSVAVTDTGSDGTITVTADGNTELTINDTTAAFSGNVTVAGTTDLSGATTITTTTTGDTLLLTTTEASSSAAPVLSMKRNSSSPADADYLGQIKFLGENDADQEVVYAKMTGKILDASDGSEDGIIEIAHKKAGSNVITGRFRSDSYQLLNGTTLTVDGQITGNLTGNVTGNAATATALATARAIGGVNFDGTAAINLPGVNTSGNQDTSGTATTATNVTASANNSSNETVYITFVDGATGGQGIETDTGLTYNPSTGVLTTTSVTGNLTGNVTGNVSGSSGSTTGNAATATALATARNIAGQSFDGTGAITIASTDLSNTSSITLNTSSQTLTNKTLTSPQINTQIDVLARGQLRLQDSSGGQYVALRAPATVGSSVTFSLPSADGTSGQVLATDGSGNFSFADAGSGGSGSSYPNSTTSTMPGSDGDFDLSKTNNTGDSETPFEAGGTDPFGVNLGTVFDTMDPTGATEITDLGDGEAYVGA